MTSFYVSGVEEGTRIRDGEMPQSKESFNLTCDILIFFKPAPRMTCIIQH